MLIAGLTAVLLLVSIVQLVVLLRFARGSRDIVGQVRAQASDLAAQARDQVTQALTAFVSPVKEGEPSPLAMIADQLAIVFAARIVQQLTERAAGIASGQARAELAEQAQELAGASPWLGVLAGILPKRLRNQLLRNPQMVGSLAQLPMFGPGGAARPGDNGKGEYSPRKHHE